MKPIVPGSLKHVRVDCLSQRLGVPVRLRVETIRRRVVETVAVVDEGAGVVYIWCTPTGLLVQPGRKLKQLPIPLILGTAT
jgi:hypothetical protein